MLPCVSDLPLWARIIGAQRWQSLPGFIPVGVVPKRSSQIIPCESFSPHTCRRHAEQRADKFQSHIGNADVCLLSVSRRFCRPVDFPGFQLSLLVYCFIERAGFFERQKTKEIFVLLCRD